MVGTWNWKTFRNMRTHGSTRSQPTIAVRRLADSTKWTRAISLADSQRPAAARRSVHGLGSPDYTHLLIEAKKLAYADRARYYADMAFEDVPVDALKSMEYAMRQNERIDMKTAATDVPPGDPKLIHGDTVYLCVVDKDRNCCSLIQSNYNVLEARIVPGDVGFALQKPRQSNSPWPMITRIDWNGQATVSTRSFRRWLLGTESRSLCSASWGENMQPQGQVQVLVNWIDFGMNIQMAGDAARVRHEGSATPTGTPADPNGGTVHFRVGVAN